MGLVSNKLPFDKGKAVIEPREQIKKLDGMPTKVVLTFFRAETERLYEDIKIQKIYDLKSEMGLHPVYKFLDEDIALVALGVGAPLAAGLFEEVIALGGETFICTGGAGTLLKRDLGCLVLPYEGVRDEGTSYHYLKPSDTVKINRHVIAEVEDILKELKVDYVRSKTWTTDAFYRETPSKIDYMRKQGCLTVDMEFSALAAVSEYRGVKFAEILYCGDDLSTEKWDGRDWNKQEMLRKDLLILGKEVLKRM